MSGSLTGGKKAAETNKQKYDALYMKKHGMTFYQYQGKIGGSKPTAGKTTTGKNLKGFAISGLAVEAGRRGGLNSSRKGVKNKKAKHVTPENFVTLGRHVVDYANGVTA